MDPASPVFPNLDYAQYWVGMPYGEQAVRGRYDDGGKVKGPIPEDGEAVICTAIQVGGDGFKSDFSQVHNVRLRVDSNHPNKGQLQLTLTHGKTSIVIQGASLDTNGWSPFVPDFYSDAPAAGAWKVSILDTVSDGVTGTLNTVYVEFMQ